MIGIQAPGRWEGTTAPGLQEGMKAPLLGETTTLGGYYSGRVQQFQVQGMELLLQLTEGEHNSASLEGTTVSANERGTLLQVYGKGPQLQVHRMG